MFGKIRRYALIVSIIICTMLVGVAGASIKLRMVAEFGGKIDPAKGGMNYINDIAFDEAGNIFVADNNNHNILKFSPDGTFIMEFGEFGSDPGEINSPFRVAVDSQGNIYVVDFHDKDYVTNPRDDKDYYRVQKFDSLGNFKWSIGKPGKGRGEFYGTPFDLAIDQKGNLYVVDTGNHRVQKFNGQGKFLLEFGSFGKEEGQFDDPRSIVIDQGGNLFIADTDNHRIQKFDPNGNFILSFGREGENDGEFEYPQKMYFDKENLLCVIDEYSFYTGNKRRYIKCLVQKFDSNGNFRKKFYAVERYYDDDTSYSLNLLNFNKEESLFLFHNQKRTVRMYALYPTGINWGSMNKNYYFEVRRSIEDNRYGYDYTTSFYKRFEDYMGWNPRQTISFDYDINDRTNIYVRDILSYTWYDRSKKSETDTSLSSWEGYRSVLSNDSSIQWSYTYDKTKDKDISYYIGYNVGTDKYEWKNSDQENSTYNYSSIYTYLNIDVLDFSDIEVGYNKYDNVRDTNYPTYVYDYDYYNEYIYMKYHTDF